MFPRGPGSPEWAARYPSRSSTSRSAARYESMRAPIATPARIAASASGSVTGWRQAKLRQTNAVGSAAEGEAALEERHDAGRRVRADRDRPGAAASRGGPARRARDGGQARRPRVGRVADDGDLVDRPHLPVDGREPLGERRRVGGRRRPDDAERGLGRVGVAALAGERGEAQEDGRRPWPRPRAGRCPGATGAGRRAPRRRRPCRGSRRPGRRSGPGSRRPVSRAATNQRSSAVASYRARSPSAMQAWSSSVPAWRARPSFHERRKRPSGPRSTASSRSAARSASAR